MENLTLGLQNVLLGSMYDAICLDEETQIRAVQVWKMSLYIAF